ncbi:alpha/beta hydrolase [Patescibacteria group bacterium]|nr:alpha/beta hydrolase [Patescibacteria group bacterium]
MTFVLIHGAFGSPESNWFPDLKGKLESLGQEVIVPAFPVEKWDAVTKAGPKGKVIHQLLPLWLKAFEPYVPSLKKDKKLVFVGHSLGCVFILHAIERFHLELDSAIFVSPFMDSLGERVPWQFDHVNAGFYKTDFDFLTLKKRIPLSYVLYSDNDPYVDKNHAILFGKALDSSLIYVKKAGHMNSEVNLNEFSLILDLCVTRLDLTLYQRYLMIQQKLGAVGYTHAVKGNVVKLNAQDALDEGVFRWRYLERYGFVTLYTGISSFWNPNSQYMNDARRAAKHADLTRVIVVKKRTDLKNPMLREQMKLDSAAGIHVYICFYDDIKDEVPEPDFGLFDDSYVCIVPSTPEGKVSGTIELNSQDAVVAEAVRWKNVILEHAKKVTDAEKDLPVLPAGLSRKKITP